MHVEEVQQPELVDLAGPWPFVTRLILRKPGGQRQVSHSRLHRKGLAAAPFATGRSAWIRGLWLPGELNWWIGLIFAIGSLLFMLGSVLSLLPGLAAHWSLDSTAVNAVFFAGSIPFTTAAFLQLYQAEKAGGFKAQHGPQATGLIGWRLLDAGWLSCLLQFLGTLLFNANTLDALLPELDWLQEDLVIWAPDFVGSTLFLVSGYLAFIEHCHSYFAWQPTSVSWWVTFANLLGCVAFMASAFFAFTPPVPSSGDAVTLSLVFTLLGAAGFLVGSLLMWPEAASTGSDR